MKTFSILLLATFASLPALADIPKKAPLVKYSGLWNNSPFTSKPAVENAPPPVNPFEDFTLTGIAPVPGGYHITIMSKKNPEIKKVIAPGVANEFKVVSVNRNPQKTLGTTVVLSSGSIQGTVSFEPEFITLKAAPAAPQGNPNLPPGINLPPGVNNPNQPPQPPNANGTAAPRQPRPRIVPPPNPAANAQQQQQQRQPQIQRENRRR